jgi:tRNA-specific 2-thiouridylase|tara:strand:- start:7995 stop:9074 length:1080 start_codon:yes stop_codon:yes gene_type:complete
VKSPDEGKIVIAMSGGVDSSVAAALLKQHGRDVVGISLQLWNYSSDEVERFGTCCSLDDLGDARRVSDKIGIPFYIFNMEKEFKEEVVDYFVSEYLKARTPIPCTLCNQKLKFDHLISRAESFGYSRVATGHYAVIVKEEGRFTIKRGRDRSRDQSYFLFNLSQGQLSRLEFPLGDTDKKEVRRLAKELSLTIADKAESREICFIPDNDYASFIEKRVNGDTFREGDIVNADGKTVGKHRGYPAFTIGQRKGLNLGGLKEPHYVTGIDPDKNEIAVGPQSDLYSSEFFADKVNWYLPREEAFDAQVQIRYRHCGAAARVIPLPGERVRVEFADPQISVTPGQSAVFYKDDLIVGGGWIE